MNKLFPIVFTLFLFNLQTFSQSNLETLKEDYTILLVHSNGIRSNIELKENNLVKIKLKGSRKKLKGNLSAITEDSLKLNSQIIHVNEIEKVEVINVGQKISGSIITGIGSGGFLLGAYTIYLGSQSEAFLADLVLALVGGAIAITGAVLSAVGGIILISSTKHCDMNAWHFYIKKIDQQ